MENLRAQPKALFNFEVKKFIREPVIFVIPDLLTYVIPDLLTYVIPECFCRESIFKITFYFHSKARFFNT